MSDRDIVVRMYNVGFGDAFLLQFPGPDRIHRVLIDCGSHNAGAGPRPMAEVVAQIIEDVTDVDGTPRIDLVVGTHRHRDHVSGFDRAEWSTVEVREVWMPWTEHPTDPVARHIRETQSSTAQRLQLGLQALGLDDDAPAMQLTLNSLTNEKAMNTLHRGFAGNARRRFLPRHGARLASLTPRYLPAVRVHLLGPSRDESVIRDMNPPAKQSYFWFDSTAAAKGSPSPPFAREWQITPSRFARSHQHLALTDRQRTGVQDLAFTDPLELAVGLEQSINGTSLVLMFEMGDAFLLFPGDAQWGTWKAMLEHPPSLDLLLQTTFLKVGHHGSHNATPRAFVEALEHARENRETQSDLWAMVSTREMKMWKEIPKHELLDALGDLTPQLARSDHGAGLHPGFSQADNAVIEAHVPT